MYSYNESLYQDHPAQITTAGHQATPSRPWSKHWIGSRATAPGPSHVPFATSRHGARPFFFCHTKKKNRRLAMNLENFVIKMWFSWDIHFFSLNWRVVFSLDPQNGQSPGEVG